MHISSRSLTAVTKLLVLIILASVSWPTIAAESAYVPAKHLEGPKLRYPPESQQRGNEGLILYSYRVNTGGDVENVQIDYSTGDLIMERHLRRWIKEQRYEPATMDGSPIASQNTGQTIFLLRQRSRGASRRFASRWRKFTESIAEGDLSKAQEQIDGIASAKENSLYEELFLQRALALYHASNEDDDQAYRYLRTIAGFFKANSPKDETIAPNSTFYAPMLEKYKFEVNNLMLGDALQSLTDLKKIDPDSSNTLAVEAHFASVMEAVSGKVFLTKAVLKTTPYSRKKSRWSALLTRNKFALSQIEGGLSSATVTCSKGGMLKLDTTEDMVNEIDRSWGLCKVSVVGEKGAAFVVAQYPE
ncbi:MAG: TonB family protein [Congregibacter sp.]